MKSQFVRKMLEKVISYSKPFVTDGCPFKTRANAPFLYVKRFKKKTDGKRLHI